MTTFNEFQRELRARGISNENAYIFTLIYERLIELNRRVDDNARATLAIANTIANFVQLNEAMEEKLRILARGGRPDGVEVSSVFPDPKEDK